MSRHRTRHYKTNRWTASALALALAVPPAVTAQTQVVSREELRSAVLSATQARQKNRAILDAALANPKVEKALRDGNVDVRGVRTAVASLDDAELAHLAAKATSAQADLAAGRITDRDLLIILVGIAALILVIIAVR